MESNVFDIELRPDTRINVCFAVMCLEDPLSGPGSLIVMWHETFIVRTRLPSFGGNYPAIQARSFVLRTICRESISAFTRLLSLFFRSGGTKSQSSDYRGTQTVIINSIKANKKDIKLKQFLSVPKALYVDAAFSSWRSKKKVCEN